MSTEHNSKTIKSARTCKACEVEIERGGYCKTCVKAWHAGYEMGRGNLMLRWSCTCGRTWDMEAPGFPGSRIGRHHHCGVPGKPYNYPCPGTITARAI